MGASPAPIFLDCTGNCFFAVFAVFAVKSLCQDGIFQTCPWIRWAVR